MSNLSKWGFGMMLGKTIISTAKNATNLQLLFSKLSNRSDGRLQNVDLDAVTISAEY